MQVVRREGVVVILNASSEERGSFFIVNASDPLLLSKMPRGRD